MVGLHAWREKGWRSLWQVLLAGLHFGMASFAKSFSMSTSSLPFLRALRPRPQKRVCRYLRRQRCRPLLLPRISLFSLSLCSVPLALPLPDSVGSILSFLFMKIRYLPLARAESSENYLSFLAKIRFYHVRPFVRAILSPPPANLFLRKRTCAGASEHARIRTSPSLSLSPRKKPYGYVTEEPFETPLAQMGKRNSQQSRHSAALAVVDVVDDDDDGGN